MGLQVSCEPRQLREAFFTRCTFKRVSMDFGVSTQSYGISELSTTDIANVFTACSGVAAHVFYTSETFSAFSTRSVIPFRQGA